MKKIHLLLGLFMALAIVSCKKDDKEPTKSSLNSIESFVINFEGLTEGDGKPEISGNDISINVPYQTPLKGLKPIIKVSDKATVSPASGTAVDFEDGKAVPFTVTAEDGTTKVYNVTINVRGEVGSGTKLKIFKYTEQWSEGDETTVDLITYTYNDFNLVSNYTAQSSGKTVAYTLVYNDDNQVIELTNTTDKHKTVYTYNNQGQIVSSKETDETDKIIYTNVYEYGTDGHLATDTRTDPANTANPTYIQSFQYTNGNVTTHKKGGQEFTATFDDKNNPFNGIFPKAYSKILAGNSGVVVNKNNIITLTGADNAYVYEYNTDNYPVSSMYTIYGGYCTYRYSYEYYTE